MCVLRKNLINDRLKACQWANRPWVDGGGPEVIEKILCKGRAVEGEEVLGVVRHKDQRLRGSRDENRVPDECISIPLLASREWLASGEHPVDENGMLDLRKREELADLPDRAAK